MKVEKCESIRKRVADLTENVDCGICTQPMDAQVAINELCKYILGEDWYVSMPLSQNQVNTEIVYAVECKLRYNRWARREAKRIAKEGKGK